MKPKVLIIIILITVLEPSCHKYTYFELTDTDINMIPYKLEQTVNFIDSLGQNFVMTVKEDNNTWELQSDIEKGEYRIVRLQSEQSSLSFKLSVSGSDRMSYYGILDVYIKPFCYLISYNKDGQFTTGNAYSSTKQYYHNSLEINNTIYYNVVEYIKVETFGYYDENKAMDSLPMRLLYNKTEGILQLEDKDKVLFSIENKDD